MWVSLLLLRSSAPLLTFSQPQADGPRRPGDRGPGIGREPSPPDLVVDSLLGGTLALTVAVILGNTIVVTTGAFLVGLFASLFTVHQTQQALVLQFGGASGTLAALGTEGPAVAAELGRELDLRVPAAPWHAHRDRLARPRSSSRPGTVRGRVG